MHEFTVPIMVSESIICCGLLTQEDELMQNKGIHICNCHGVLCMGGGYMISCSKAKTVLL